LFGTRKKIKRISGIITCILKMPNTSLTIRYGYGGMMMTAPKVKSGIRLLEWRDNYFSSFIRKMERKIPGLYRRGLPTLKNGGYTMALVRHTHTAGSGLSPEQLARINAAAKLPITYDEDCPELTDEHLAEFQPVNFSSMEERARAMRAAGIISPALEPAKAAGK
jgi:hypothetical protein